MSTLDASITPVTADIDGDSWNARRLNDGTWQVFDEDGDPAFVVQGLTEEFNTAVLTAIVHGYYVGLQRGRVSGDAMARRDIRRALFADLEDDSTNERLDERLEVLEEPEAIRLTRRWGG